LENGRRLSAQASHLRQCEAAVTPPSGAGHRRSNDLSNRRRAPLYRSGLWLCLLAGVLPIASCATSHGQGSGDGQLASEQSDFFVADNMAGGAATGAVIGCIAANCSIDQGCDAVVYCPTWQCSGVATSGRMSTWRYPMLENTGGRF